ncbi:hypothetical protein LSCM4_06326 [Leishmania orientalis]|uniref:Serine/threonine-protein phosphatase n=1 Tax=Leishmania orientalis TaxID=2249476 RepID=A0A836KXT8_9TRYP|nr:hypothetical protein LSCM4_06326 [Leishmania orientalis]
MNALTHDEQRDDYIQRFALRELVEHWLDRASVERPEDPYQYLIDEASAQRRSGGGLVTCPNQWCNMTMPASQFEAHQRSCNNASGWVRCVRCNMRVDVSKMSHHRMYCRLERCTLCGEVVLPRMLLMCPYRLIAEAERDRQAAMHRLEQRREGLRPDPEAEAALPIEASIGSASLSSPRSPSMTMMSTANRLVSRCETPRASSAVPAACLQGVAAPSSLSPTERPTTRANASGDRGCSAASSASASHPAIIALRTDISGCSDDAATSSSLAASSGRVLAASESTLLYSAAPTLADPSTSATLEHTLLLEASCDGNECELHDCRPDSDSGSKSQTTILSASPAVGRRPSFATLIAADNNTLCEQLDNYPDELLPAIRSLQRLWRRNFFVHLFRKEVLGGVWRQLDSAQEKAAGKNPFGIANRMVDRSLRERCTSCEQSAPGSAGPASGGNETRVGSGVDAGRGAGLRSSSPSPVPDNDLVAHEAMSASFNADPVAVSDEELESGGYMQARDLEALIRHFAAREVLPLSLVLRIVRAATKLLRKRPVVQHLAIPQSGSLVVVGDIHGQMKDLEYILSFMGPPTAERFYLFNGDFIDRGPYGCEVLVYIFSLLCTYPDYVYLNRGNHENYSTNTEYGFMAELYAKYGARSSYLLSAMVDSYEWMPLLSVIDHRVAVVHGGAPRLVCTLNEIEAIGHVRDIPVEHQSTRAEQLLTELLWNDPVEKFRSRQLGTSQQGAGWRSSSRGCGVEYLSNITEQFLKQNDLSLLIRSHDVKTAGFELVHRNKSITVFSASNYGGVSGNRGAVAVLTRESAQPIFHTWFLREDYRQLRAEVLLNEEEDAAAMIVLPHHNDVAGMRASESGERPSSNNVDSSAALATPSSGMSTPPNASFVPMLPQKHISFTHLTESAFMTDDEFIQAYYLHNDFVLPEEEGFMSVASGACSRGSAFSDVAKTSEESTSAMACISADKRLGALVAQPKAPSQSKHSKSASGSAGGRGRRAIQGPPDSAGSWYAANSATASRASRHALQAHHGAIVSVTSQSSHGSAQPMARVGLGLSQDLSIALQLQTIQQIRELVYFNRYALLAAFNQVDEMRTGTVYKAEWCVVTRDVLKLDIPWYYLCQYLVPSLEVNGVPSVEYMRFLRHVDVHFALESRLSWQRATIARISGGLDIPEDIISAFCDRPMKTMSSNSSRVQSTGSRGHSNGGGLSQNSSLRSPLPIISSPATVPSLSVGADASTDSPLSVESSLLLDAMAPVPTLSPPLPQRSFSSPPTPPATTLPTATILLQTPVNAARRDCDDAESAAHAKWENEEEKRAVKGGAQSTDENWWCDVRIGFNTFANKVRVLSPAAAAMEDNEVFALFCYFDVGMQGHVYVGDVVNRMTELLKEGGEEEAVLLVSGELDFSAVPGGPQRGAAAGPPTTCSLNSLSASSTSSGMGIEVSCGNQGATACGAPEADCGDSRGGGGGRALLLSRWNSKAKNGCLARFGRGGLSAGCDATSRGGGVSSSSSAVDAAVSGSSFGTSLRPVGHRREPTSEPEEAKEIATWPAEAGDCGTSPRDSRLDGAIGGCGDSEPESVVVGGTPSSTKPSPPSSMPEKISRQPRATLPTSSMALPLEHEDDAKRRASREAHGAAAGEASEVTCERASGEGSMDLSGDPNKSSVSSLASAAERSSTHVAGAARTVALPLLQAGGTVGSSADGRGFTDRKNAEGSTTAVLDVPKPPCLEVVQEPSGAGNDVLVDSRLSCASDSALLASKLLGDYSRTGDLARRPTFNTTVGSGVSITDSDAFRLDCSSQDHPKPHQPPPPPQQQTQSLRSKHLSTPPWIFSALLRVQEQLLGGHSRLRLLFAALNQSKNGRLSEKEFVSLIEFMNLLLEYPLSDGQARELFRFVHESAIRCVQSVLSRHQRVFAAGPLGRGRSHHTGSTTWGDLGRMPGDTRLSVSPMLAGMTCEADTEAYVQSRMQAEQQRGGAYILFIEFMAFFSVKPVPHGDEVTATEELLRAGTASVVSGGAAATGSSVTAPSALAVSLSDDLSSSYHQQLQGRRSSSFHRQPPEVDSSGGPMVSMTMSEGAVTSLDYSSLVMKPAIGSLEAPALVHAGGSYAGGAGGRLSNATKAKAVAGSPSCDSPRRQFVRSCEYLHQLGGASTMPPPPRESILSPTAVSGGLRRGPRHSSSSSLSTAEQAALASAAGKDGTSPSAQLLIQPAERVASAASQTLGESTKKSMALPSSSLASWGPPSGSCRAGPVTLTTQTTDAVSLLAELRSVYGECVTLKELLQMLSTSLLPILLSEPTTPSPQEPLRGASTSLPQLASLPSARDSRSLAALDGVAARAVASTQRSPYLAENGGSHLSAAFTSETTPAAHLRMMGGTDTGHGGAAVAIPCQRQGQSRGVDLEGELSPLLMHTASPAGAGSRRRTVRSHRGYEGDSGVIYPPRVPNSPAMCFAANNAAWRFSNKIGPSIMPTARPYMLNQPTELRVTGMAAHSYSLQPISLDVPHPSDSLIAAHFTGLGDAGADVAAVAAGSRGCLRAHLHGHDRSSRRGTSSMSLTQQPPKGESLSVPVAPHLPDTPTQHPCACAPAAQGAEAFSDFSASDSLGVGSKIASSIRVRLTSSGSDEARRRTTGEGSGGGTAVLTNESAINKDAARGEPPMRSGCDLALEYCAEKPHPQRGKRDAPSTPTTYPALASSLPRAKPAASKWPPLPPAAVAAAPPREAERASVSAAVSAVYAERNAAVASMLLRYSWNAGASSKKTSTTQKGEPSVPAAAPATAASTPSRDRPLQPQVKVFKRKEAVVGTATTHRVAVAPATALAPSPAAKGAVTSKAAAATIPAPPPIRAMPNTAAATSIAPLAGANPSAPASPQSQAPRAASDPLHDVQPVGAASLAPAQCSTDAREMFEVLATEHPTSIITGVSAAPRDSVASGHDVGGFVSLNRPFATRLSYTNTLPPITPSQPPSTSTMSNSIWLTALTSKDQLRSLRASQSKGFAVANSPDAFVLPEPSDARSPAAAPACRRSDGNREADISAPTAAASAASPTSARRLDSTASPTRLAKGTGGGGPLSHKRKREGSTNCVVGGAVKRTGKDGTLLTATMSSSSSVQAVPPHSSAPAALPAANAASKASRTRQQLPAVSSDTVASTSTRPASLTASTTPATGAQGSAKLTGGLSVREGKAAILLIPAAAAGKSSTAPLVAEGKCMLTRSISEGAYKTRMQRSLCGASERMGAPSPPSATPQPPAKAGGGNVCNDVGEDVPAAKVAAAACTPTPPSPPLIAIAPPAAEGVQTPVTTPNQVSVKRKLSAPARDLPGGGQHSRD